MNMNKHWYLTSLWDYPAWPQVYQSDIEQLFEDYKYTAMCGDDFAAYAVFVLDLVCHRREANMSLVEMESLINSYDYPDEFSARLTSELESIISQKGDFNMNMNKPLHMKLKVLFKKVYPDFTASCLSKDRKEVAFIGRNYCCQSVMEAFCSGSKGDRAPAFLLGKLFDCGVLAQDLFDKCLQTTEGAEAPDDRDKAFDATYKMVMGLSLFDEFPYVPRMSEMTEIRENAICEVLAYLERESISIGDDGRLLDIMTVCYDFFVLGTVCVNN